MGRKSQYPTPNSLNKSPIVLRFIAALSLFIGTGLLVIFANFPSPADSPQLDSHSSIFPRTERLTLSAVVPLRGSKLPVASRREESRSPIQKPHPLPSTLAKWQDSSNSGDYFAEITPTQVGYLVWSQFPVKVYIEQPTGISKEQAQVWIQGVSQAVQEWNTYLPLLLVPQPEVADIKIIRKAPPLQISPGNKIPRARSAQTSYELYSKNNTLSHRFIILLSPSQTGEYVTAAIRHELGHALGIWGHSPVATDALYFAQVRNPPPISPRDVNTLKRVYQQPTSLGWSVLENQKIIAN